MEILSLPANGALENSGTAVAVNDQIASADLANLTFIPTADWNGSTSFGWKAFDQSDAFSASASVNITINPANDAPTVTDVSKTGEEDAALTFAASDFTGAFSDIDSGDSLKAVEIMSLPANGALENFGTAVSVNDQIASADLANLTFIPTADWNGSTSFGWKAFDQSDAFSASANVNITVNPANDAPTVTDVSKTGDEDATLTFAASDFTGAFSDIDAGDSLKIVEILSLPANGTLKNSGTAVSVNDQIASADLANLTFVPDADWNGSTSFTWKASDQSDAFSASANVNITINPANDAPNAFGFSKTGTSNTDLYFSTADFANAVSDPDAGDAAAKVQLASLPNNGVLYLNNGGTSLEATQGQIIDRSSWAGLFFRPDSGWHGQTSFGWKAYDSGGLGSNTVQAVLTINSRGTPPTADAGPDQEVVEGSVTVTLDGSGSKSATSTIASYQWTQVRAAGEPSVVLSNQGQGAAVTFVTPPVSANQKLTFELKVTDSAGIWSTDQAGITVKDNGISNPAFPSNSLTFFNSSGTASAVTVSGGNLTALAGARPEDIPFSLDKPVEFLTDVLALSLVADTVGGSVKLVFYLESPAPDGYKWMKYQAESGDWLDYSAHASFNEDRTQVTVELIDGGDGDQDGAANGVIIDPSGLGLQAAGAFEQIALSAGTASKDFRIISMPVQPDSTDPVQVLGALISDYDTTKMRIGFWDAKVQAYTEYPFEGYTNSEGAFVKYETAKELFPGWAAWFLFRQGADLVFNGTATRSPENPLVIGGSRGTRGTTITLHPGWNQIGNPYQRPVDVDSIMVYDGATGTPVRLTAAANNITDPVFWVYDTGDYLPLPVQGGSRLALGRGGWVNKITAGLGYIFFPVSASDADVADSRAQINVEELDRPPAPPDLGGTVALPSSPASSKEGGCFIDMISSPAEAK
ncbi:MAG: tandem-95 repeat protein [Pseudomonadota bacterium]